MKLEKIEPVEPDKYRFVCYGCTKDVLRSTTLMHNIQVTCPHCGKQQTAVPENWVVL